MHFSLPLRPARWHAVQCDCFCLSRGEWRDHEDHSPTEWGTVARLNELGISPRRRKVCREPLRSRHISSLNLCNFLSRNYSNEGGQKEEGGQNEGVRVRLGGTGGPSSAANGIVISDGRTESTVFQLKNLTNSLPAPITNQENSYCFHGSTQTLLPAARVSERAKKVERVENMKRCPHYGSVHTIRGRSLCARAREWLWKSVPSRCDALPSFTLL